MEAYLYPLSLLAISVLVALAELFFPWRKEQKQVRAWIWSDVLHLVFNGHFLGVMVYVVGVRYTVPWFRGVLESAGLDEIVHAGVASTWPVYLQIVIALLVTDFVHWCVHNLLHRVPWLWEFHKTHHSVQDGEMDWIVAFRFQWTEVVVYKSLQYMPLAFFGFGYEAVMVHAIFGTLIGHLNHSNLDLSYGPLRYVFNSPRMHLWHHDYDADGKTTVNFGVIFSLWDWIFGTAFMPNDVPRKIGFEGVETFPRSFFGQAAWPLQAVFSSPRVRGALGAVLGGALVGFAWWWLL